MKCQYAAYSGTGERPVNEDSLTIFRSGDSLFAAVADGVGGHENGQAASRIVTDVLGAAIRDQEFTTETLTDAIDRTGRVLAGTGEAGYSTVAALWIREYQALAAHVGDSRIYQFRMGNVIWQSADHSIVQIQVSLGDLEPQQLREHEDRSKLYRVLGDPEDPPLVDCHLLDVLPGDRFLICSDGLWEPVTEDEMCRTCVESETVEDWNIQMRKLVKHAAKPEQDNYTAICIVIE